MANHNRVFSENDVEKGELTNENPVEKELEEKEKIGTVGELIESASNSNENVKESRELKVLLDEEKVLNGVEIQKEAKSIEATSSLEW